MIANQLRYLLLAIDRYTRFPLPPRALRWASPPGLDSRRAVRFLPVAGVIVGLYGAVIYLLFVQLLPHAVATLIAVIFAMLITGGRHELGFGRFFGGVAPDPSDAAAAGAFAGRPARARPATSGLLAIGLLVLLRVEALGALDPSWVSVALLSAQPLSCGIAAIAAIGEFRRLGGGSATSRLIDRLIAAAIALLPLALIVWWFDQQIAFSFALVPTVIFGAWLRLWLRQRLRAAQRREASMASREALVADGASATQQATELAFQLGLLVWWTLLGADLQADTGSDETGSDGDDESPDEEVD